jgi:hypothetical protein
MKRALNWIKREWFLIGYTNWLVMSGLFTFMEVGELDATARELLKAGKA